MSDHERIVAAYLFLCALEKAGTELTSFNIHLAWIDYCRTSDMYSMAVLLGAAGQMGFAL